MSQFYLMRRANGDVFTMEIDGQLRIPVWRSEESAARYKVHNPDLIVYFPVKLGLGLLKKAAKRMGSETPALFLLDDTNPDVDFDDGRMITGEDIAAAGQTTQAASAFA